MLNTLLAGIPAETRRRVYLVAFLAWLALAAWEAGHGDWKAAAVAFVTSVVQRLAGVHVDVDDDQAHADVVDDPAAAPLSYDGPTTSGGAPTVVAGGGVTAIFPPAVD